MKIIDNSECLVGFGKFVRDKREKTNLYQTDMAKQLGITQAYYSNIERGTRNVDLVLALKICQILNLDLNDYIQTYLEK